MHVPCFGPLLADINVNKGVSSGVIRFDRSRRLRMTKSFKRSSDGNGNLAVAEKTGGFGFGCRGDNGADSPAFCMNRAISRWRRFDGWVGGGWS